MWAGRNPERYSCRGGGWCGAGRYAISPVRAKASKRKACRCSGSSGERDRVVAVVVLPIWILAAQTALGRSMARLRGRKPGHCNPSAVLMASPTGSEQLHGPRVTDLKTSAEGFQSATTRRRWWTPSVRSSWLRSGSAAGIQTRLLVSGGSRSCFTAMRC